MKRLAVIDGKSVFYRGYYSMPNLSLPDGTPTGGVFGFTSLAIELIKKLEPDYVAIAWDKRGTNIRKRREIYSDYKANRKPAPDDFYEQIPILNELLDAFGWPLYELDDYEADDIMGAFAKEATEKGIETYLITSDLDALQLISPTTKVYAMKNGLSNIEAFDVEYFEKKYGIRIDQFLDLKALQGDSSDNLPGVPGVGSKTGIKLLQKYDTLDGIYEHLSEIEPKLSAKLVAGKESAYTTKKLASIWTDAPVKLDWAVADVNDINLNKVADILKRLEFNSLARRLPQNMRFDNQTSLLIEQDKSIPSLKETEWSGVINDANEAMILINDDELWVSFDKKLASRCKLDEISKKFWHELSQKTVIGYDMKKLYHELAKREIFIEFPKIHDINQAAFLIDPLARDRSLSGLSDYDVSSASPLAQLAALCSVYSSQLKTFENDEKLAIIARQFDFPLVYILFKMEYRGVKIDTEFLSKMSQKLATKHRDIEQQIFNAVGYEFNIASPMQLSEVLFTKLQLPTAGIKKGKTGYSTGQSELNKLRGQHPIIELIEQSRELAKLQNTYVDALPKLVDNNSRIHTTFNQDVVSTGRLSSTNPNLQNIPIRTALGREIRTAFITDKDKVLVSADYSQFELRLASVLAGDKQLIDDFNHNVDIHTKTASEVYGIPMDEVTKSQRRNAKVINFGILYGMSPHGLSVATGMSVSESKKFIDSYFELRESVRKFLDEVLKQAKTKGYVETYFGRRRPTPDVQSSNYMIRSSAERAAMNMPIQGTEADLMKLAMIKIEEQLGDLGEQILQIHDSILVECSRENAEKVKDILRDVMENIAPSLGVKLKVDVTTGDNWGEL